MSYIRACGILGLVVIPACDKLDATRVERASRAPLGVLQGRDYSIEIFAGPVFTVLSADGEVLAELMTTDELQAMHPELHRKIEHIYAGDVSLSRVQTRLPASFEPVEIIRFETPINYCPAAE